MASNPSCLYTPPKSPEQITAFQSIEHVTFNKEKSSGCVYPNYKRKQPPNLKIRTTNLSNPKTVARTQTTSLYQMINTIPVPEPQKKVQKVKSKSPTLTPKQEKIMENTYLICSFLNTICVEFPVDENNYQNNGMPSPGDDDEDSGHKKSKYVSLEKFVADILLPDLSDTIVYVALFFISRYLYCKRRREENQGERAMVSSQNNSTSLELQGKRCVNIPKSMAIRMTHSTKSRHSISKGRNKIKLNKQSIHYLYQQSKKAKKVEGKKRGNVVVGKPFDFSKSLIKTKKDLIFVAMICSSKYVDDNTYTNNVWKELSGKSIKEVFDLEREFLISLDYKLYFRNEEWKEWCAWISNFKDILDNGLTTSESKSSPSGMISVPLQPSFLPSPSSQYTEVVFPTPFLSPVELPTPTSANSSSNIPLIYRDEEDRTEEKIPLNYPPETNNIFFPPLTYLTSYDKYYPHQRGMMKQYYANPYGMPYPTEVDSHYNYSSYPPYYEERADSYEMLMYSQEMMNKPCYPNLIDTIDTCLISQAQNTQIDFSEIQELSQKQNFIFKEPVLPRNINYQGYF